MNFSEPFITLDNNDHVIISIDGRRFPIPEKILNNLINDTEEKIRAITDEDKKYSLIIRYRPKNEFFYFKPLIRDLKEIPFSKEKVIDMIEQNKKRALEEMIKQHRDIRYIVPFSQEIMKEYSIEKAQLAKEDRSFLESKYGPGKSLEELRDIHQKTLRREYLQEKFGKGKSLREMEELERREEYRKTLEKKFGSGKSILELELLESQEIRKTKLAEKYGFNHSLEELEKFEHEYKILEE